MSWSCTPAAVIESLFPVSSTEHGPVRVMGVTGEHVRRGVQRCQISCASAPTSKLPQYGIARFHRYLPLSHFPVKCRIANLTSARRHLAARMGVFLGQRRQQETIKSSSPAGLSTVVGMEFHAGLDVSSMQKKLQAVSASPFKALLHYLGC